VLERYFEGDDYARGSPLGKIAFKPDTLHDLRSASKSIVGLLYGIALADRKVPPPEAPLFASFPEFADLAADPARNRWTIHHVLTMTMGTDWDELGLPYTDPANSETAMHMAPDRYRFVLGAPVWSRASGGSTTAAPLLCWHGLSSEALASLYSRSPARFCSILLRLVRRNGLPMTMAKPLPRPACA
jgi:CubicO group peptidase (beta-lactamase class C family)